MTTPRDRHARVLDMELWKLDHPIRLHGPYSIDCHDCGALVGEPCTRTCPKYGEAVSVAPRDAQGYS